jgi:hypothetical protein
MLEQGFLIVERFESLYVNYKNRYNLTRDVYAIPRIDHQPQDYSIQYRGIDRDCLEPNDETPRNLAELRMAELYNQKSPYVQNYIELINEEDFIPINLLEEIYALLENDKSKFETIFVRIIYADNEIPARFKSIGYEPSIFYDDHFSASCDCMLFPRWHGTDEEGELFIKYFNQLNSFGLFNSIETAEEFLQYYLSFDWTERDDYYIVEVLLDEKELL